MATLANALSIVFFLSLAGFSVFTDIHRLQCTGNATTLRLDLYIVSNIADKLLNSLSRVMNPYLPTEGSHTLQMICSCDLYNHTRGYCKIRYKGEDFIRLNLASGTWSADKPEAENVIHTPDLQEEYAKYFKDYMENDCIDLIKLMNDGNDTLERKDHLEVSVFHKHSPSPEVVCHTTGFFPKTLTISWQKDGEDVNEGVNLTEMLPNPDGSFQKRIILTVPAEELQKHTYTCVVQHSSLEKDLVLRVRTEDGGRGHIGLIIGGGVLFMVLIVVIVIVWKKRSCRRMREQQINGEPV